MMFYGLLKYETSIIFDEKIENFQIFFESNKDRSKDGLNKDTVFL